MALPECFNCPYGTSFFPAYAETIPGTTTDALAQVRAFLFFLVLSTFLAQPTLPFPPPPANHQAAADANVYVIGGSIPEQDGDRIFNSCAVFSPTGDIIAKHRKVHLFDIDVPGKITFKESTTLTAGDAITVFDTPMCRFGVAICYDIRFPELTRLCADQVICGVQLAVVLSSSCAVLTGSSDPVPSQGCAVMCFPGAFNMTTGPAHWELLLRARFVCAQFLVTFPISASMPLTLPLPHRAVDNQMYVAGISPARDLEHSYHAWGHSTLVSPWFAAIRAG